MCPLFVVMPRFVTIKKEVDKVLKKISTFERIYHDLVLPENVRYQFIAQLAEIFGCEEQTLILSCTSLESIPFGGESLYELIWRLCANKDQLRANAPVLKYPRFQFSGIEEVQFLSTKRKDDRYFTPVRILTGHYAYGIIKCEFSVRAANRILMCCGFHGRKYIPGKIDECMPGLFAKADLMDSVVNPKIFANIESDSEMEAFNRKYVIGPRIGCQTCPLIKEIGFKRCKNCPITRDRCFASYKEKKND